MPNRNKKTRRHNSGLTGEYQAIGIKAVAAAVQFARATNSRETSFRNAQDSHRHISHATKRKQNATSENAASNNPAGRPRKSKQSWELRVTTTRQQEKDVSKAATRS